MAKRKRNMDEEATVVGQPGLVAEAKLPVHIQIITGSYDRLIHGIIATISSSSPTQFADSFLLEAHTSALRCLALSPPSAPVTGQLQKIILATGGTDERINLYHLSAHPPALPSIPIIPSLTTHAILENPSNRSLGSLSHHSSLLTALDFPTRSKLLSCAEDSTIAITRTRDWSLLTSIKAPIPKAQGRPSGDTAPLGSGPSGINDFAVHPSMKVMLSVGKGERCMRLWNLVTGKKAGVLGYERDMLRAVGEGKYSIGEGRKVVWGGEDELAVAFERGVGVWGMDCKIKCFVMPEPRVKICRLRYVRLREEKHVLAISTEDGRVIFYSTEPKDLEVMEQDSLKVKLPAARWVAQLGGKTAGIEGRIKDFVVLRIDDDSIAIITSSSDGTVRIWRLSPGTDLVVTKKSGRQVGEILGTYKTNDRITCMTAFVMLPLPEGVENDVHADVEDDFEGFSEVISNSESEDSNE